jgi:hypothetical protein
VHDLVPVRAGLARRVERCLRLSGEVSLESLVDKSADSLALLHAGLAASRLEADGAVEVMPELS